MKIFSLKCNHMTNPIGFKMDSLVFQFKTEGGIPASCRLIIALEPAMSDPIYDSGERTDMDPLGFKVELALAPRTRYFYQVLAKTEEGDAAASDVSFFETGKMDEAWQAKFICAPEADSEEEAARLPVFTREIPVKDGLETASLYITATGVYEAYIGEERVGDEFMTPYCNNYNSWLQVQTYDVTELLEESNVLSIGVGDGWFKGRFGFDLMNPHGYFGNDLSVIAELHLMYENGEEEVIGTDESWKVQRSHMTFSNIYDGEVVDDTLGEIEEKNAIIFEEYENRFKPVLSDRLSMPVHIIECRQPKELIITNKGEQVLDIGQNMTGSFELKVHVPAGEKVYLQFGEILQEGNFFRDNLRSAKAEYTYISNGEETILRPRFTFYGYRYVKVEGIKDLCKDDFTALVLHSDLDMIGKMTTGNAMINQLLSNVIWGQKGNFLDVPTDCPQRDERMGWTGDAEVFCPTASYWMDTYAFYTKYLHDMYTEQLLRNGEVPHVVPSFGLKGSACAWADAATIIPWKVYVFTGDKAVLEKNYPGMKAWVDYVTTEEENDHTWEKKFHYGDWLALDHPDPKQIVLGGTAEGFIAEVYYLYSTRLTAKAAAVLGLKDDQAFYEKQAENILGYIRENYFTPTGRCAIDTQTAHILTLVHGLSVDPVKSEEGLKRLLTFSHGKLKTGFVGTPQLCPTLSRIGENGMAYDLLFNEEYPGWLYEVKNGATTVWERWNSVLEDGRLSDLTMNSLNHYAYGSIAEWIWQYAAGLEPDENIPGFKMVHYHPHFDERMGYMNAEYKSAAGTWKSLWRLEDGKVTVTLSVPEGCCAIAELPGAGEETYAAFGAAQKDHSVGAGIHEVTYSVNVQE